MSNPLSTVLGWLHAGYPVGIPPKDFYPLLSLLVRTLDPEEVREIVSTLITESQDGVISADDAQEVIAKVKDAPVTQADLRDVAARLAAVGWPLRELPDEPGSSPRTGADPAAQPGPSAGGGVVARIIDWLGMGYPNGVPTSDRMPILALLRRRLTDTEVDLIARELSERADAADHAAIDPAEAQVLITEYTNDLPSEDELKRVASRLAAQGWPLA